MKKNNSARGFTLIEILVVIFIMSIVTSVALLTISRNQNRQLEAYSRELQQTLALLEEEAMLKPSVLGVSIEGNRLQLSSYHPAEGEKKSAWKASQETKGVYDIPRNIELSLEMSGKNISLAHDDEKENHAPHIVISTNGDITPFTIYVARKGKSPRYVIKGDANGNISSQLLT